MRTQERTQDRRFVKMGGGPRVLRNAVNKMAESVCEVLGYTLADLKENRSELRELLSRVRLIPHQANIRIISASCDRLGIGLDRASIVLDHTGNTSAASVPLALADALDAGRVSDGDLVLFVGFGAGMTSASAVVRWDQTAHERLTHDRSTST